MLGQPGYNQVLHYEIPIVGRPFVTFSSGSFTSTDKRLRGDTYAWKETVGSNNTIDSVGYTLVKSGRSSPAAGVSAFGNVELKASRMVGLGISAGVGLTIEDNPRLAYLGGVSIFLGDLKQFVVTYGVAAMQMDKLKENFQTIANDQTVYTSKVDIAYDKDLKFGAFFSLSYTPFKRKKK